MNLNLPTRKSTGCSDSRTHTLYPTSDLFSISLVSQIPSDTKLTNPSTTANSLLLVLSAYPF